MIWQLLTWRAILDVLLIAAGLFFLYRTLIRLGTWKIVAGILIAILCFVIASFLDLKGIEWIYRNVSHVAALGFIVLFQPELRKMFERAASIRRFGKGRYDEHFSRLIAESMWKLASKRVGAIIVVPGQEPIREWLTGGYPLNADPSVPLIMSIFDPNSPGHDGALVIRKGRFSSFGVRLPISQSGKLSEEYGTRHQAAMGLSEKSDAFVIVVSEERGKVSIFHQGKMNPINREEQISNAICSHCGMTNLPQLDIPGKKFEKTIVLEILGSLVVAFAFWATLIAAQGEMLEKVVTAPVEYTATAEDVVMIGDKAKEIRLHLAGSKSDLDAATPSELSVKIDLAKTAEGKQTFVITDENIRLPKGVRLLDVDPSSVEITIAKLIKKEVGIKPQLVGKLPVGLRLVAMEVKPKKIRVLLPSGENGEHLESVTTTPIYLESIHEDTSLFCKIISPPSIQPADKRWPDVEIVLKVDTNKFINDNP